MDTQNRQRNTAVHPLPELLSPAGSPEALQAALAAGADAVYFGGSAFSNRMRARNFDADELTEALHQTRRWGVKSYITINTRVRDDEMADALQLAEFLLKGGCSGFITADMGIAAQIHSRFPEAALHASTQMTLANAADARMMAEHGFTRMVVPREISLAELRRLTAESPLEIEMFLHGAYCVSVSGQCLMSWAMGGRSGNRGECAQPCRMTYRLERGIVSGKPDAGSLPRQDSRKAADYPLSLRDMCLAGYIPQIIASGAASLKIEGRQKPAPYVYGVTKIYRTLLDERRAATEDEIGALDELFSRGGFTDGYFRAADDRSAYSHMGGIRPTTEEQQAAKGNRSSDTPGKYDLSARTSPCTGKLILQENEPAVMTMTHVPTGTTVTVTGEIPQRAAGAPVTPLTLAKNLSKLGGTPFRWAEGQPESQVGEGLWYPVSAVNAIRRNAAEALENALHPNAVVTEGTPYVHMFPDKPAFAGADSPAAAVLTGRDQWSDGLADAFETVYIPAEEWLDWANEGTIPGNVGADLPPLVFDAGRLQALTDRLIGAGCRNVRFHSPGQLFLLRGRGVKTCGSFRLNVWNSDALAWWYAQGADRVTVSPEVTLGGLRGLAGSGTPGGAVVYGHIPLMLTERCVLHGLRRNETKHDRKPVFPCGGLGGRIPQTDRCFTCGGTKENPLFCTGTLTDRMGSRFPMQAKNGETVIYNSLPLWMGDKTDTLPPLTHREYLFTTESAKEILQVLRDEKNGVKRAGKRLK